MSDVKWIKIATGMFDNRKIKQIRKLPEGDAIIVIWLQILCLAGITNDSGFIYFSSDIPYTDEMLSVEFDRPVNIIRIALQTFEKFGMLELVDNLLMVSNWKKYQSTDRLEAIKEKDRERKKIEREQKKQISIGTSTEVPRNVQGMSQEIPVLDIDIDKDKDIKKNTVQEACTLFEKLWDIYPNKKGKGQVSDTKKKSLLKIGEEELTRAIDRYKLHLSANKSWLKPQNGSTFFNSGYLDYLDSNYHKEVEDVGTGKPITGTQSKSLNELAAEAGIE